MKNHLPQQPGRVRTAHVFGCCHRTDTHIRMAKMAKELTFPDGARSCFPDRLLRTVPFPIDKHDPSYSFLPADGVENLIHLRARVRQRLQENAEVVGADEAFFEDEQERQQLLDLYHE